MLVLPNMYALQVYISVFIIFIAHLDRAEAQYPARVGAQTTRPAHLFPRQISSDDASCAAGATSCNDGQAGCCNIGQACSFDDSHRPVCSGSCAGLVLCSGDMAGLCCNPGYTCNTQATLCESTETSTGPIQTGTSTVVATAIVTASSQLPPPSAALTDNATSQAMPSAGAPLQASLTSTTTILLPAPSDNYYTYTFPSSSTLEAGLVFTYKTVTVTDPPAITLISSSDSEIVDQASVTSSANSAAVEQVTKTITTVVRSGQGTTDISDWRLKLVYVLAFMNLMD